MGKNEDEPMAMASTTKIMTCLIALENGNLSDTVEISDYAASMPDVQLDAIAGDHFRLEDLLYALMLESDNDAAVAIAEHVGGSVEGFAEMMNARLMNLDAVTPVLSHQMDWMRKDIARRRPNWLKLHQRL